MALLRFTKAPPALRLLQLAPDKWGVGTGAQYEARMQKVFEDYFKDLQESTGTETISPDWSAANARMVDAWEKVTSDVVLRVGTEAWDKVGKAYQWDKGQMEDGFLLDNPYTREWVSLHSTRLTTEVSESTLDGIHEVVRNGIMGHQDPREIARAVKPLIGLRSDQMRAAERRFAELVAGGAPQSRAMDRAMAYGRKLLAQRSQLIARTEVMTANNQGLVQAWNSAASQGLVLPQARRVWVASTTSDRTCDICKGYAGQEAELNGEFTNKETGATCKAPPAHPSCRCSQGLRTRVLKP